MTFETWWNLHRQDKCICPGTCLWRILEVQEGWVDDKARKNLLGSLKLQPTDEMPQEYIDGRKASVLCEDKVESGKVA